MPKPPACATAFTSRASATRSIGASSTGCLTPSSAVRRVEIMRAAGASMREWPEAELFLADLPQAREAVRLGDQEEDDHGAEDHELEVLAQGRVDRHAECGRHLVQQDRHDRDEGCTQEAADDRAQPADDHHE